MAKFMLTDPAFSSYGCSIDNTSFMVVDIHQDVHIQSLCAAIIECSYAHRALANHANSAKLSITGLIPLYSACGYQLIDMQ